MRARDWPHPIGRSYLAALMENVGFTSYRRGGGEEKDREPAGVERERQGKCNRGQADFVARTIYDRAAAR